MNKIDEIIYERASTSSMAYAVQTDVDMILFTEFVKVFCLDVIYDSELQEYLHKSFDTTYK